MYEHIPQKLKDEALFCVWKRVISKNKVQKKPFQTNGIGASHSNPKHFTDFKTACDVSANGYDGIGIGVFKGISAVDIDSCVVDGVLTPKAQKVVDMMDSYSEISPSGTGIRIVFTAADFQFDKSRYYIHNSKGKMEIYVYGATNKFLTITGNSINDKDIEERGHQLKEVLEEFMVRPATKKSANNILAPGSFLSDEEVIMKASDSNQGEKFTTLWNGDISSYHNDHSRADNALLCILAFWCGGDREQMKRLFEQSALYREEKWEQLHGAKSYADMSIDTALSQTDKFYQPNYYKGKAADDFNFILEKLKELHPESNGRYKWTEIGAGRLFADIFKGIARFVPERKKWYFYDGKRWIADIGSLKIMELCKEFADATLKYSKSMEDDYWSSAFETYCEKWQKRGQRICLISDAESVYPLSMTEFDNNRLLFNCDNGTIELQPFCFREHRPEDFITKISSVIYDPNAQSPKFLKFVKEIMSDDMEKARFLQKSEGYGITGETLYECMFIHYGPTTRNGKGTFDESVLSVTGDYGRAVRPETIAQKNNISSQSPSEDIARLAGIRFANISEPKKGLLLDSAQVKSMTGNDTLNARFLHENSFDFKPQFKLYINTNYLPAINDMSIFTSGRIYIIPFDRHFEEWEQDPTLKAEFQKSETQSAILNWLLEGYQLLKEEGLKPPKSVVDATESYYRDSDKLALFAEECLEYAPNTDCKTSEVYLCYRQWCELNGYIAESNRSFNQMLRGFGVVKRKRPSSGGEKTTVLIGYRLLPEEFLQ